MEDRKVYILLTDTGTIFTRMIKFFTKRPLNHASISFDSNLKVVYSFGRKRPSNPFIAGFVLEDLQSGLFLGAEGAIFSCSISQQQYENMIAKIKEIEAKKQEYKYNLIGLFAVLLNKEFNRKNAFFCSQFVASVLNESGIELNFNKPLSLVTPDDLSKIPAFQLDYIGKISIFEGIHNQQIYPKILPKRLIS